MSIKGIFKNLSTGRQFCLFLFLTFFCLLFFSLLMGLFAQLLGFSPTSIVEDANAARLAQFFSAIITFLVPSLIVAWFFSTEPRTYLYIESLPSISVLFYSMISFLLLLPFVGLTEDLNKLIVFPDALKGLEQWMIAKQNESDLFTKLLLSNYSWPVLLANFIVIGLTAGVVEEFFFRGAMMRIMKGWIVSNQSVIWIVALIFSAVHLQFYGFIPRLILGALLGYLLLWTKSLWVPIFAHVMNNTLSIVVMSVPFLRDSPLFSDSIPRSWYPAYIAISFICLAIAAWIVHKKVIQREAL